VQELDLPGALVVSREVDLGEPVAAERLVERPVRPEACDLEEALLGRNTAVVALARDDDLAVGLDGEVIGGRVVDPAKR